MSEFLFLVRNGQTRKGETAAARRIAKKHGAYFVRHREPRGEIRTWFAAPNLGFPFDRDLAERVAADLRAAGFPR